jgi:lipoate-protein ligase A
MDTVLLPPPREPAYRKGRQHSEFLTTLDVPAVAVRQAIQTAWKANTPIKDIPHLRIETLVHSKYSRPEWNSNGLSVNTRSGI